MKRGSKLRKMKFIFLAILMFIMVLAISGCLDECTKECTKNIPSGYKLDKSFFGESSDEVDYCCGDGNKDSCHKIKGSKEGKICNCVYIKDCGDAGCNPSTGKCKPPPPEAPPCKEEGNDCKKNEDCCSKYCYFGKCYDYGEDGCAPVGKRCSGDDSCCSDVCVNNVCTSCEIYCKGEGYEEGKCVESEYKNYYSGGIKPSSFCHYNRCAINITTAKDSRGYDRPWIYCSYSGDYEERCYCYNVEDEECTPHCKERCTNTGCKEIPTENCCNGKDDDFNGQVDAEDGNCTIDITLAPGENDVCWWGKFPYDDNEDYRSGIFSCPENYRVKANIYYMIYGNYYPRYDGGQGVTGDTLDIYDGNNNELIRHVTGNYWYKRNANKTSVVGPFLTNKVYFRFVSDYEKSGYDDDEFSSDSSKKDRGVKVNSITCELECDSKKSVCECTAKDDCCSLKWIQSGEERVPKTGSCYSNGVTCTANSQCCSSYCSGLESSNIGYCQEKTVYSYTQFGEMGCCGDDVSEYLITSNVGTQEFSACCNQPTDCVGSDNKCYSNYTIHDNLFCLNGKWDPDLHEEDCCDGKDQDFDDKIDGQDSDIKDCGRNVGLHYGNNTICWNVEHVTTGYRTHGTWGDFVTVGSSVLSGIYSCPEGYRVTNVSLFHNQCIYSYRYSAQPGKHGDMFHIVDGTNGTSNPRSDKIRTFLGTRKPETRDVPMLRYPDKLVNTNKIYFWAESANIGCYAQGRDVKINSITCDYNCFNGSPSCSDNGYVDGTNCYYNESFSPGNDLFSTEDDVYIPPTEVVCDQKNECSGCADKKCYYSFGEGYKWDTTPLAPEKACQDGHDNDCDGKADANDEDCHCNYGYECHQSSPICVGASCSNGECTGKQGRCKSYCDDAGKTCSEYNQLGLCHGGKCMYEGIVCAAYGYEALDGGNLYCDTNPGDGVFNKEGVCTFISEGPGPHCSQQEETVALVNQKIAKESNFFTTQESLPESFSLISGECEGTTSELPPDIPDPRPQPRRSKHKKCSEYDRCNKKDTIEDDDCEHTLECYDGLVCCENKIEVKKNKKWKRMDDLCLNPDKCWGDLERDCDVNIVSESCNYNYYTKMYDVSMTVEWSGGYKYRARAKIAGRSISRTRLPLFTATSSLSPIWTFVDSNNNVHAAIEAIVYNDDNDMVCSEAKFVDCKRCDEDTINYDVCSLYPNVRCAKIEDDLTFSYGYCNNGECAALEEIFRPITVTPDRTFTCDDLQEDETCTLTWTIEPGDNNFNIYSQITPPGEVASQFDSPKARITTPAFTNDADKDGIPNEDDRCPQSKGLWSDTGCPSGTEDAYPVFRYEGQVIDNSIFRNEDGNYMKLTDYDELSITIVSDIEHTYHITINVVEDTEDTCSGYLSGYNEIYFDDGIAGGYDLDFGGKFVLVITSGECNVDMITISVEKEKKCPPQCDGSKCDSKDCVCGEGEGDCDKDSECEEDLICCKNIGSQFGCKASRDICLNEDECYQTKEEAKERGDCSDCDIIFGIGCNKRKCESLEGCVFTGSECVKKQCTDPDGKNGHFTKGKTTGELDGKRGTHEDKCLDTDNDGVYDTVVELYCEDSLKPEISTMEAKCHDYGCNNGACLKTPLCEDKDGKCIPSDEQCADYSDCQSSGYTCREEGERCCQGACTEKGE